MPPHTILLFPPYFLAHILWQISFDLNKLVTIFVTTLPSVILSNKSISLAAGCSFGPLKGSHQLPVARGRSHRWTPRGAAGEHEGAVAAMGHVSTKTVKLRVGDREEKYYSRM